MGELYLKQSEQDSAAIYFNKGVAAKNNAAYNQIGLGHLDLDNDNATGAQAKFDAVEKDLKKKNRSEKKDKAYVAKQYPKQEPSISCRYIQKNF